MELGKPLRVVVECKAITTDAKGHQFAEFEFVQQSVVRAGSSGDDDEDDAAIQTSDTIPEGYIKTRMDTEGARSNFGPGKRYMLTFQEVPRQ